MTIIPATALSAEEANVIVGAAPHHAYLQVNGQTLVDQPGAHLSRPLLSPDGRMLAVVVVPNGAETAHLAQIHLFAVGSGRRLALLPGHSPTWDGAGANLHLQSANQPLLYHLPTRHSALDSPHPFVPYLQSPLPPLYPITIRVRHHPSNGCRNVPADQIDEIPFEEYVARVAPAEMPAFWPVDALAAQSVAVRTYAWRQILVGRPDYDVSDWADFQVMCDQRYPTSDAAVAATAGHYLSEIGDPARLPIFAMYSAENGHPTLTNANVTYLQAVPDLFALGQVRFGHGYGLSQWGAQRRALAGHTHRQILAHYYRNVHLQNANEPDQALGAFRAPTVGDWWTTSALRWQTLTTATPSRLTLSITATHGLTATHWLSGNSGLWQAPALAPDGAWLTSTLWVDGVLQDQIVLPADMTTPAPPVATISAIAGVAISLTVSAEDDARIGLQEDWRWQGEALAHTPDSGHVMSDTLASNGLAWAAQAGVDQAGVWYGPYTRRLPLAQSYRALFWLRTQPPPMVVTTTQLVTPVARLDVTDDLGNVILGLRDLWPSDFSNTTAYQPIAVDFHLFDRPKGIELRLAWPGLVDLALDRVEVWTLPSAEWQAGQPLAWRWNGGSWPPVLALAAFDQAGHVSQAISYTIPIIDINPPTLFITQTALTPQMVQLAWQTQDDLAGPQMVELEMQAISGEWQPHPQSPWATSAGSLHFTLSDDRLLVRLRAVDRAGQRSDWHSVVLQRVANWLYLPLVFVLT